MDIRLSISNHNDKKISLAILSSFLVLMTQFIILSTFDLFDSGAEVIIKLVSKIIVIYFYLRALQIVIKRSKNKILIIYGIAAFIIILNILIFPENIYLRNVLSSFLGISLPTFFYLISIKNLNVFYETTKKIGKIIFFIGILLFFLNITNVIAMDTYSMSYGYYLLLPSLLFLKYLFENSSVKYLMYFIISTLIILALGSRGPLLSIAVFVFLYVLLSINKKQYNSPFVYLIPMLITTIYFFKDILLNKIEFIFNIYGIDSRSLKLISEVEDKGVHWSGRENNFEKVWNVIEENSFIGKGITGDATILGGGYVHNIILELWVNYGIIIGSLILIIILTLLLLTSYNSSMLDNVNLLLWFSTGFIPLLISGTYLTSFQFWIFLGLLFNLYINRGYQKHMKTNNNVKNFNKVKLYNN